MFSARILLFCLCLTAFGAARAQQDTLQAIQVYERMSAAEKNEWTQFRNQWSYEEFPKLLQQAGIRRLGCAGCKTLYADLYIEIDAQGRITRCVFVHGMQCDKALPGDLADAFNASVKKAVFHAVKNRKFKARFGQLMTC